MGVGYLFISECGVSRSGTYGPCRGRMICCVPYSAALDDFHSFTVQYAQGEDLELSQHMVSLLSALEARI